MPNIVTSLLVLTKLIQPLFVEMSSSLGTTNDQRIDVALKMQSCDVISTMHCLTSLKIVAEL